MHVPFQRISFLPVFFSSHLPRLRSGANMISFSFGILLITCTAFEEVQQISVSVFNSAVQFTYDTTTASGCISLNFLKSGAGHESASEQPAFKSGNTTFLCGDNILAVSAIKCTPANAMISASVEAACCDNPKLSPM